jgi:AcrR family transcriptional regulator
MPKPSGITLPLIEKKRPRGRVRSKKAEDAVLNAAYKLLSERGLQATTVDAIASESNVSKATIYKWWPNRAAIIMSAFLRESLVAIPYPTALSLDAVIERLMHMSKQFRGPLGTMMSALIAEGQSDQAIAQEFREGYISARRAEGVRIVKSSIAEGVVRDADPHVILDVLYAPLYYRLLVGHQPLTEEFVRQYLDLAMRGILRDDSDQIVST